MGDDDAASKGNLGAGAPVLEGTGVATDYLAERDGTPGTPGWSTHAITPRQEPLSLISAFTAPTLRGVLVLIAPLRPAGLPALMR